MQNVIFGTRGTVLVEGNMKDMLGSSSTAVTQVEVLELTVAARDDVPLDGIASLANLGDSFASLLSDFE